MALVLLLRVLEFEVLLQDTVLNLRGVGLSPLKVVSDRLEICANFDVLLNLISYLLDYRIIRWLLLKLQGQNFLKNVSEGPWYKLENFLGVFEIKSFPEEILELVTGILKLFVEVSPWQITLVQEINHNVHQRLDIVSSALVVSPATVETREQEVTTELLCVDLLDVCAIFI